jgi:hypothetical protein
MKHWANIFIWLAKGCTLRWVSVGQRLAQPVIKGWPNKQNYVGPMEEEHTFATGYFIGPTYICQWLD